MSSDERGHLNVDPRRLILDETVIKIIRQETLNVFVEIESVPRMSYHLLLQGKTHFSRGIDDNL